MAAIEIALRTYARRAREFSDLVALLGRHNSIGPEVLKLFKRIKRQRELCGDAEAKLQRYIKEEIEDFDTSAV